MMDLKNAIEGKVYRILCVPPNDPCQECSPCLKLKIMEMGLFPNENILMEGKRLGIWIVKILDSKGNITSTLAMREDEVSGIEVEENLDIWK